MDMSRRRSARRRNTYTGENHGQTEERAVDRRDRRSCRRPDPRTPHHAGPDPAAARRDDRRDLSTGSQIRARHQSRLSWKAVRDCARVERADHLFLRRHRRGGAAADHAPSADAAGDRPQLCRDQKREASGSGEPARPRLGEPVTHGPTGCAQLRGSGNSSR